MGDYSRNTFRLTNVMYQVLTGETVTDPRHYVGLALQQGVPLLDADWNDSYEIRQRELELLVRDVIGNGVPGVGQGFRIDAVEQANDFAILAGLLILDGWQVINPKLILYSQLPRFEGGGTDLSTPSGNRSDIVYLDVMEEEVTAYGSNADERLVNETIGIETATRIERRWTVRVAENHTDFGALALNEPGHKYYPLARLKRNSSDHVEAPMIEDLRRLGLNFADSIKAPMYISRGTQLLNAARFSAMLKGLRDILKLWQQNELFPIILSTTPSWLSYQNAANEIYYLTTSAEVNADTGNLDNGDGLVIMQKLVEAQHGLLEVIQTYGTGVPAEMAVVDLYADYLDGNAGSGIDGIQPSLDDADLLGAVIGQEALNLWLGLSTGELPQGDVTVILSSVTPATAVSTSAFQITYTVTSDLSVPTTAEQFNLEAVVSDVRWAASLNVPQVTLVPGASQDVIMTIDPDDSLVNGDFADINLVARAQRRPSIQSELAAQRFTIGQLPPGETFFFYSGAVELVGGKLTIPRADIETVFYPVDFTLVNTSGGAETHTFRIEYELSWPGTLPGGVVPGDWTPSALITLTNQDVTGSDTSSPLNVRAPNLSAVSENVEFTLSVTVTLTAIDAAPISNGKTTTLELPIIVDMS